MHIFMFIVFLLLFVFIVSAFNNLLEHLIYVFYDTLHTILTVVSYNVARANSSLLSTDFICFVVPVREFYKSVRN